MSKFTTGVVVATLAGSMAAGVATVATAGAAAGSVTGKQPASAEQVTASLAAAQGGEVSAKAAGVWPVGNATLRVGGANRWETAQAVSMTFWEPENTFAVALVSGENFPDSLSLPPTMSALGPTLLVGSRSLPAAARAELQRLRPCFVVAAGGTAVISDAVLRDADQYADPTQPGCE